MEETANTVVVDPVHGTVTGTEVPVHHEETLLGLSAEAWVYVSLTIFILLAIFVGKAPQLIAAGLDKRIAGTRRELDEARAIRAEAEALLTDARARQEAAVGDARSIMTHAEQEASQLVAKAQVDADLLVERRRRMAEDKIAAAERAAVDNVRQTAADAAARAARTVIESHLSPDKSGKLVDEAIAGLRLH
jgi:F-type H+-transporting ATPase subunit b